MIRRRSSALTVAALFCAALITLGGCGSSSCAVTAVDVIPPTATADHTSVAPGNSQGFTALSVFTGSSACVARASAPITSNWTVSDPSVHLSATQGSIVTATCTAAVATPVTVTATAATNSTITGRASLTCK